MVSKEGAISVAGDLGVPVLEVHQIWTQAGSAVKVGTRVGAVTAAVGVGEDDLELAV